MKKQCVSLFKGLACLFFIIGVTAFQIDTNHSSSTLLEENDGSRLVTLHSDEFDLFSNRVYRQLSYSSDQDTISPEALSKALRGYMYLKHTQALQDSQFLTIIDFSKHCNSKRMWVIDMDSKSVVINEWVAHGAKTGNEYAKYFSNRHSSHRSSLGFYTTGGLYYGRKNLSLKLNGLEKGYNSNAFARGVVIHGANYISESIVNRNERIGRSFGCPAVSQKANKKLVNTIKGGNCLFIYYPSPDYLAKSEILNGNLYITVDDLSI
ncbi:MAG: murein L,D-transpeptidase catalytic domain family protein [Bacteroidia bacterium]